MIKKAVIPCAGLGTRFLPETKVVAKELFPINGRPVLDYLIDELEESNIEEVLVIVSPQKEDIVKYFKENKSLNDSLIKNNKIDLLKVANPNRKIKISFAVQNIMDGNGSAVSIAKEFVKDEPFVVLFGDDLMKSNVPVTKQMIDVYDKYHMSVVGTQKTSVEVATRCGVIVKKETLDLKTFKISGLIEKPSKDDIPSDQVSLGRFLLTKDIFDVIDSTPKRNGEIYLTDCINVLSKSKDVCSYEFDAKRYDIGNKEGYLEAVVDFALEDSSIKDEFTQFLKGKIK